MSREAERALRQLGVEVLLDRRVEDVDAEGVTMSGERVAARTVLWAAGVMASPAASWLGVEPDRAGRVPVQAGSAVAGTERVFAVGDTAASMGWSGQAVPGSGAGGQAGRRVCRPGDPGAAGGKAGRRGRSATAISAAWRRSGGSRRWPISASSRLSGALAWWLWGAAHIAFLVGGRNRLSVLVEWFWAYLTFRRGTRLITDYDSSMASTRSG